MAIGNLVGGRLADRVRSGLRLYAGLELLLVVVVLVTPALFTAVRGAYGWAYSMLEEDHVALAPSGSRSRCLHLPRRRSSWGPRSRA